MSLRYPLPPKRWQPDGPEFDALRHHAWFTRGLKRKAIIPVLAQALVLVNEGQPQWKAAAEFQVDERELRDYAKYVIGQPLPRPSGSIFIIDAAYAIYCDSGLKHSFNYCMEKAAEYYGQNPRAMRELWETDPVYFPSVYQKPS